MYYLQNYTYRQIVEMEKRDIKTVHESVQAAKKKFIKFLEKHPNKLKLKKGLFLSYN